MDPSRDFRMRLRSGEQLLAECSERLLTARPENIDTDVADALRSVVQWLGADTANFSLFDDDRAPIPVVEWDDPEFPSVPTEIRDLLYEQLPGYAEIVSALNEPVFVHGIDRIADEDLAEGMQLIRSLGAHAVALFAVRLDGDLRGIVSVGWRHRPAPTKDEVHAVGIIGNILMSAIRRAETEQAVTEQATRFEAILRHATEGMILFDADGGVHWASESMERTTGISPAALVGSGHIMDLVHPEDLDAVTGAFRRSLRNPGRPVTVTFRLVDCRGNDRRFVEATFTNLLAIPAVNGIVCNAFDVTDRILAAERLQWAATRDALTGLLNTQSLLDVTHEHLQRLNNTHLALLALDLDRFRVINDSLGHDAGNHLLVAVAERLRSITRADTKIARTGGDEFAILCPGLTADDDADALAERLVTELATPFTIGDLDVRIGASVGVAMTDDVDTDASALLHQADAAMYRAKRDGRARFIRFDDELHAEAARTLRVEQTLHRALAHGELTLHFQPIVELENGRVTGCEALVRWQDPVRGLIPPNEFIPVAEETGLVVDIGAFVLDAAVGMAAEWHRRYGTTISVNVAVRQLVDVRFPELVAETLERHGLPPEVLCLELTETGDSEAWDAVAATLQRLSDMGVRIAIDDLGTGYATLERLRDLPVDVVKLDASHVGRLGRDPVDTAIVRALADLAGALDVALVAEGVETEETHAELRALGCTLGQGYLFGRPVPASDFEALLHPGATSISYPA